MRVILITGAALRLVGAWPATLVFAAGHSWYGG